MTALYTCESTAKNPLVVPYTLGLSGGHNGAGSEGLRRNASMSKIDADFQTVSTAMKQLRETSPSVEFKIRTFSEIAPLIADLESFAQSLIKGENIRCEKLQCAHNDYDISILVANVKQAEMVFVREQDMRGEDLRRRFGEALQTARASENPIKSLEGACQEIDQFYMSDIRFSHLLRDMHRLMIHFQESPSDARLFVLPLFQKVFVDNPSQGGLTPLEGGIFAARLVFVIDNGLLILLPNSFDEACKNIETIVESHLKYMVDDYEAELAQYEGCLVYEKASCQMTLLPQAVAKALMRADGTLNLGIVDLVKRCFLPIKADRDSIERHIALKLQELKSNGRLLQILETIPLPTGAEGKRIVNSMLLRRPDRVLSVADVRVTVLAALLTWWRQGELGNCYVVSAAVQRQEAASEWLLEDFKDLLLGDGAITRNVEGSRFKFFGLQWPQKVITEAAFSEANTCEIFVCDAVENALQELGCNTIENFFDIVVSWKKGHPDESLTLRAIFEELALKNGKGEEASRKACLLVESPGQNLLFRAWENAIGSMLFIPVTDTTIPTHVSCSQNYFSAIVEAFFVAAKKYGLAGFQAALTPYIGERSVTASATTVPPGSIPLSLQQFRACLVPQAVHSTEELSWALCREKDGQIEPFKNRNGFAAFLQEMFLEWGGIAEKRALPKEICMAVAAKGMELLEHFESVLLADKTTTRWGVIHETLCYSTRGEDSTAILERADFAFSRFKSMNLGINKQKAIHAFLNWTRSIREIHGDHQEISFVGCISDHMFRILPNHPTIIAAMNQAEDPVKSREQFATKSVSRSFHASSYYIDQLSGLIGSFVSKSIVDEKFPADAVNEKIIKLINLKLSFSARKVSIKSFLPIAWAAMLTASKIYASAKCAFEEIKTRFYLSSLMKLVPDYQKQFIHFADTNWECSIGARTSALHYCFWFDPIERRWEILDVSEAGEVASGTTKESSQFLRQLEISPDISSLSKEIQQKRILDLDRKTRKALQKIERQFVDAWAELVEETSKLRAQDVSMKELISEIDGEDSLASDMLTDLPVGVSSASWNKALQLCGKKRQQYEHVVEERLLRLGAPGDEFRFTYGGQSNSSLPLLIGDADQFLRAVRELLFSCGLIRK